MKTETRGLEAFIGEEVVKVDAESINVVHFYTKSGKVISIDAKETYYGIPVIAVNDWSN